MQLLSESILPVHVHWVPDKDPKHPSKPCFGRANGCPWCRDWAPWHWYAYLGCCLWPNKALRLAQITEHAWQTCRALQQRNGHLRGQELTLRRDPERRNARMWCQLQKGAPEDQLPPAFSLPTALCRLWGLSAELAQAWDAALQTAATDSGEGEAGPEEDMM